jgi:hypothetical protein
MNDPTISITINGNIKKEANLLDWLSDAAKIFELFECNITHVGIGGAQFKSGKALNYSRMKNKIIKSINASERIDYIEFDCLPTDYRLAAFDYKMGLTLSNTLALITLIVEKKIYQSEYDDMIIEIFKKYMTASRIEKYEMDKSESPIIYAAKANPTSYFKTLNIVDSSFDQNSSYNKYLEKPNG